MAAFAAFPRISPFLWFDSNAEEAANFYVSIFPNSRILEVFRSSVDTPSAATGKVLTVSFELDGQKMIAMNGGPVFTFNKAISFSVRCDTQAEIDHFWDRLVEGGKPVQCGWLDDRYGLSWQIVPQNLPELIKNPNGMKAMMSMVKFDIAALEAAAKQG